MNVVEIPARKIVLKYPSEWDEIPKPQAVKIGRLLYFLYRGTIDPDQFRKLAVDIFIRRVNNMARKLSDGQELDLWGNEWLLAETVNFFFDVKKDEATGKETYEIMPRFVKNLIPSFRKGLLRTKYYGPGDFLNGMVFAEFKDAMAACDKFMQTSEEYWLNRLTAILYRRRVKNWVRDLFMRKASVRRISYDASDVDYESGRMKNVPIGIRFMAFLYMMGCLYMLRTDADGQGIEIDGQVCSFSMLFKGNASNKSKEDGLGMLGVMMALAESGVFGNIHKTARADVWDVLARMYQLELQRRDMEREMNKKSKK